MAMKKQVEMYYAAVFDQAFQTAISTINNCKGYGAFAPGGGYKGIWLADSIFTLEAYRYFGFDAVEILKNIIVLFGDRQDENGDFPTVFWGDEKTIDYGGRYDMLNDRKQHRDMETPYLFIHANYLLWKNYNDGSLFRKYHTAMKKSLRSLERRKDSKTQLILSTYGPAFADICVDDAVPQTTVYPYFTSTYVSAYKELYEMAASISNTAGLKRYSARAESLRKAMNKYLWSDERGRYEVKIMKTPVTTDETMAAFHISEDTRFPVICNMMSLYHEIPDDERKVDRLIRCIEDCETGLKVWGRSIFPAYPDNYFTKQAPHLFNNGNYFCGDVWTWFSNKYALPLFKLGYPGKALDLLKRQADVAVRDNGFSEFYEDDAEGKRKGNFPYAGTASSFIYALVEGLFGLRADYPGGRIFIHPSLRKSGRIRCRLGEHDAELSVVINKSKRMIRLEFKSTYAGKADFRVLIPREFKNYCVKLLRDGIETMPVQSVKTGESFYMAFEDELKPGLNAYIFEFNR